MEPRPLNVVGPRVRQLRDKLKLTQEALMARCQVLGLNITRTALARIESRERGVADHEAQILARALRVPVGDLFPSKITPIQRRHSNPEGSKIKKKEKRKSAVRPTPERR